MANEDLIAEVLKFDPGRTKKKVDIAVPPEKGPVVERRLKELMDSGLSSENSLNIAARENGLEKPRDIIGEVLKFDPGATGDSNITHDEVPNQEDMEWKNVFRSALSNAPGSAWKFGEDIVSAITSPVQTAKALGGTALGAAEKVIPGEQSHEKYIDALVEDFKQAYGSLDNFKKTVAEDPVRVMADVSSLVTGTGAAIRGVGVVSGVGKAAEAGKVITKIGASMEPISAVSKLASIPFKAVPEGLPIKLYESAVKFSTELPLNERHAVTRTAVSSANQIMPTTKGLTKLRGMIDEYNQKIGALIDESTARGTQIDTVRLYTGLRNIAENIAKTSDEPLKVKAELKQIGKQMQEAIDIADVRTPEQIQKLKQRIYKDLESYYEKHMNSPAKVELRKGIARNARGLLEQIVPEIKQLNQKEGALIELWDAIESKANRISNRDLVGIGIPVKMGTGSGVGYMFGGATGGAVGSALGFTLGIFDTPQVKAKIALVLNRLREKGATIRPTMAGVRLGMYESLKMQPVEEE